MAAGLNSNRQQVIETEAQTRQLEAQVESAPYFQMFDPINPENFRTPSIAVTPDDALKKKRKKKMDVAETIVQFAKGKAKQLGERLKQKKQEEETIIKDMKEKEKRIKTLKYTKENLEEKYNELTQTKRSELVNNYRRIITQLKQHPLVEDFSVDIDQRILITTAMLTVVKDGWDSPKEIGKYQIRIDFSKDHYSSAIKILNLTKRFNGYDSPTISNTSPCWGNIGTDIEVEFSNQDLYELTLDLIDYITSPNVSSGYLAKDGDKQKGWEQFLENTTPQPENYSFEKHDQQETAKTIPGISVGPEMQYSLDQTLTEPISELSNTYLTTNPLSYTTTAAITSDFRGTASQVVIDSRRINMEEYEELLSRARMDRDDHRMFDCLRDSGLIDRAAYYFMGLIREELQSINLRQIRPPNYRVRDISIRESGADEYMLFVSFVQDSLEVLPGDAVTFEQTGRILKRYYINSGDIERRRINPRIDRINYLGEPVEIPPSQETDTRALDRVIQFNRNERGI